MIHNSESPSWMENKEPYLAKSLQGRVGLCFPLSKPEIEELPQPIEQNVTMARVTSSRVVWSDVQ
jgi:hypothetical protein